MHRIEFISYPAVHRLVAVDRLLEMTVARQLLQNASHIGWGTIPALGLCPSDRKGICRLNRVDQTLQFLLASFTHVAPSKLILGAFRTDRDPSPSRSSKQSCDPRIAMEIAREITMELSSRKLYRYFGPTADGSADRITSLLSGSRNTSGVGFREVGRRKVFIG